MRRDWRIAKGHCGYQLAAATEVHAAYTNGVALFALKTASGGPVCVVVGHMTCGGSTLDEAKAEGVRRAEMYGRSEPDRRLSLQQFDDLVAGREEDDE